jgi:hypothetical protein
MSTDQTLWRAASLLTVAIFPVVIAFPPAKAQRSDRIETMNERNVQDDDADTEWRYIHDLANADKTFGPDHPRRALTRSNLGGFYKSHGRLRDAEPLLKSALEIDERIFGTAHPKKRTTSRNSAISTG